MRQTESVAGPEPCTSHVACQRTGQIAVGPTAEAVAGTSSAFQCPTLIKQVGDAASNRFDDASNKARQLAAEAEELHKAGKHAESVAKAQEAKKLLGI